MPEDEKVGGQTEHDALTGSRQKLLFDYDTDGIEVVYISPSEDITFTGKMDEPIHRWFRLTAAFSPALVRHVLNRFHDNGIGRILDPFCGTGTTLVEAKLHGHDAIGVEYNPVYHEVATTKTTWPLDTSTIESSWGEIHDTAANLRAEWADSTVDDLRKTHSISVPEIYNRERWWDDDVLKDLLVLRTAIERCKGSDQYYRFFRLCLLAILIDASNASYDHVSLTFDDEHTGSPDVFRLYQDQLADMIDDVEMVSDARDTTVSVVRGDSTEVQRYVDSPVSTVITSPPYPNRYSYVRETRPHMFFYDMVDDASDVGDMALDSVGGTWGRATSSLQDGEITFAADCLERIAARETSLLAEADASMRNYLVRYLNSMHSHLAGIEELLADDGQVAYTVGNAKLKGVVIPTDEYLAEMLLHHGFSEVTIARARQRNSKQDLYEAIVYGLK